MLWRWSLPPSRQRTTIGADIFSRGRLNWRALCHSSRKLSAYRGEPESSVRGQMNEIDPARKSRRLHCPGVDILCIPLDDPGRRGEAFHGSNPLLEPPSEFRRPILELPVDAEIMGPVLRDIGIELGLPADGDEIGMAILEDGFRLLCLENDANRHRRDADVLADPFGVGHLETEATRDLRRRRRA